jgi:hypothetical protein
VKICTHNRDGWVQDDDGVNFCEECNAGVCSECGAIFECVDEENGINEAPCDCLEIDSVARYLPFRKLMSCHGRSGKRS